MLGISPEDPRWMVEKHGKSQSKMDDLD